ncbi:MAG: GIY-YIG nuclease family protein [Verrucomicrobiales bacterium]|nr:GIY-YIG nuclease family protein [Verrucomicrobiales bacterium]
MESFHDVYILESESTPGLIYTGQTSDLRRRLVEHNAGKVVHTSKFVPWRIRSATAFRVKQRALAFERYLKSGSGRAFLKRHL